MSGARLPGMDIRPIILEGRVVRLEPLSMDHHAALCAVGFDPELWRWTLNLVETPEQCEFLKREGCRLGQGFLFSPAVPADEIEPLFHRFEREPAG